MNFFCLISCFHDHRSDFKVHTSCLIKQMCERNCLLTMNNLMKSFLENGSFLNERVPFLTKGHLHNPEGLLEVASLPPNWKLFLTLLIQIKKKSFSKRALFNETSNH